MATLTVIVLAVNAAVVVGGALDTRPRSVASAAVTVAVAAEPEVEADLDPLEGVTLTVPVTPELDPSVVLPIPEPAPSDPYAPTPEIPRGQLDIPAIGVSQPLFEGVTLTAINRGPSLWPGTADPGELGNVVVAGHRTTYSKPFYYLNELVPGDELIFTVDGERIVYELDRLEIVEPTAIQIIEQTPAKTATLFACHPRGSARQRIVGHFRIKADTVSVDVPNVGGQARSLVEF